MFFSFFLSFFFLFLFFFCVNARSETYSLHTRTDPRAKSYVSWNVTYNNRSTLSVHDSKHMRLVRSPVWCISLYDRLITSGENNLSVNWGRSAKLGRTVAVYCIQLLYQREQGFEFLTFMCPCIFSIILTHWGRGF